MNILQELIENSMNSDTTTRMVEPDKYIHVVLAGGVVYEALKILKNKFDKGE